MKKLIIVFVAALSLVMLSGCKMAKELAYFQNMDSVSLEGVKMRPEIHIKPNDELTITVTSTNPEAAEPFNMTLRSNYGGSSYTSTSILTKEKPSFKPTPIISPIYGILSSVNKIN